jgi:DNA polymerase I
MALFCYNNLMKKPLLVLFDGNAIVHRAYHAFQNSRPLTVGKTGELVSAVYGFAQMLMKAINDLQPDCYAVSFDKKAPTFRHEFYDQYKANRPAAPDDLVNQFGRVRELVQAFNIPIYELDGYEADDVLGALSKQAVEKGFETIIVTGDADTMQLVNSDVKVLYPKAGKSFSDTTLYDQAAVAEKFGVKPEFVADFKALVGDPSDNIPGVRGIGDKTAVKLIQRFGHIEQIYEHLEEVEPARIRDILRNNEEAGRQSKVLATIDIGAPVTLNLDDCGVSRFDRNKVTELFRELEFSSLLDKLPGAGPKEAKVPQVKGKEPEGAYTTISTGEALDNLVERFSSASSFAFDIESTSVDAMSARLVGISLASSAGESFYIPVGHTGLDEIPQLSIGRVVRCLEPLMVGDIRKIAHNAKYDMTVLVEHGLNVKNCTFDTMVAAHLLGEKALGLKALAFAKLGVEMMPISDLIGTGAKQVTMDLVDIKRISDYACADADMTLQLEKVFRGQLDKEGLWQLFSDVEMPLIEVLMCMERNGVALDTDLLARMSRELGDRLQSVGASIFNEVGHQLNINSPQQLSSVLFEELHLTPLRKSRGHYSTDASVLEELRGTHPVIEMLVEYRQLSKLKSTYIDALPGLINSRTGRLHTTFNQTKTATGRLSSSDPNLQNIPIRAEMGRKIRQAFIAPPGCYLLGADYSQIDLRSLAHLSHDKGLLDAFNRDEDIHSATASQLFGVRLSEITPDMRRLAKTVNFGVIYGMSSYGLEQATELSREEAAKFIVTYFEKYPGVKQYMESTKQQARDINYVQTLLGRRRHIPEVRSANRQIREAAERMAINMPVQGTSADIIKVAMLYMHREMKKLGLKSKMLLQVHDELVFEVPEEELGEMKKLVPDIMASALPLTVPLKVDTKVGSNWGEME